MRNGTNSVAGTPADPTVHYHKLELDGEELRMVFDFNAIAAAEQVAKVNLLEALDFSGMTAAQYRGLFWAALLKAQPKITLEEAGALITLKNMPKISDALLQAWKNSLARAEPDSENPRQPDMMLPDMAPAQ